MCQCDKREEKVREGEQKENKDPKDHTFRG